MTDETLMTTYRPPMNYNMFPRELADTIKLLYTSKLG